MPNPKSGKFIPAFFPKSFSFLYLGMSFSVVNFCVCYDLVVQLYSFTCETLVVLASFVEKTVFAH